MGNKIQILRNAEIVATRDAAKNTLKTKLADLSDGEIAIARYEVNGSNQVKVLLGFNNTVGSTGATKQFIFDADAIPADVQTALDAITGDSGAVAKIKGEVIGTEGDASSASTIYGAKKYADEKVISEIGKLDVSDAIVSCSFVASVSETDGKISVKKASVTSSDKTVTVTGNASTGALDLKANIDGTTIVKDSSTGKLSVASSALAQYVGSNAIAVSGVSSDNNKTISLGINTNDKVLSQSTSGLLASLSLNYSSDNKQITLVGKNNAVISTISTNDFVKDGMLNDAKAFLATGTSQEVQFKGGKHTFEKLTKGNHYIGFEFKTSDGTTTTYTYDSLDATTIIDVYVAGDGLALSDHTFSVKKSTESDSEGFLSVSSNGVKVSGVQTAINTAAAKATTAIAAKTTGHVTISSETATDGHTTYTFSETDIASASDLSAEVTRAKGSEDTIEASVGLSTAGAHVKTSGHYTSAATTVVGEIAALDAQVYTNTTAITDEVTNRQAAITNAINALDVTAVGGTGKVITTVSETDGKISATAIDLKAANVAATATDATDAKVAVTGTTVEAQIGSLATSIKTNSDAITAETTRAKEAEEAIDTYVGKTEVPTGKTVMGVIIENEETAANAINTLAKAAGLIDSDDKVSYTAPTVSGEFSTTSSVMDMLNHIDAVWNTIDCGTY